MGFQQRLEDIIETVRMNLGKGLFTAGLLTAIGITALKDNVHFTAGYIHFKDPKKTQYVWGILPFVYVDGAGKNADIVSLGLLGSYVEIKDNSTLKNADIVSLGLLGSYVGIEDNSTVKNVYSLGTGVGSIVNVRKNARVEGNIVSAGIGLNVINNIDSGTLVKGNVVSCGIAPFILNQIQRGSTVKRDVISAGVGFLGPCNNIYKETTVEGNSYAGFGFISSSGEEDGNIKGNEAAYGVFAQTSHGFSLISGIEHRK
ncbi:hypothetical protein J7L02_01555 [Candidatus Woesearchaeota archaeon]|nr:hypothetical protein [Candidatus Woesearchaeota archaeon]